MSQAILSRPGRAPFMSEAVPRKLRAKPCAGPRPKHRFAGGRTGYLFPIAGKFLTGATRRQVDRGMGVLTDRLGGKARRRAVLLLGAVLALASADTGAIGALAPELERSLHIGNVDIGLLVTVSGLTASLGMLPVGWATDRWCRTRMLTVSIVVWGLAQGVSAFAVSFLMLLIMRLALGALTATTGPTVASLTGDLFPASERSRIYGFILAGELAGAGFGLLVAGLVASWTNWRVALVVLALPAIPLAWSLKRYLQEPARGGSGTLEAEGADPLPARKQKEPSDPEVTVVMELVDQRGIAPSPGSVLGQDPMSLSLIGAVRYILRVRSNVLLTVASALGYFFFSGLETFALIYLRGHYRIGQGVATLVVVAVGGAAVGGTVVGGRVSDSLLHAGKVNARLGVAAAGFIVTAVAMAPAILNTSVLVALPFFLVAGFALASPNPGLDAARLDVMPSRMWGRAEAIRSLLRSLLQSFAPLLFGLTSVLFGGHSQGLASSSQGSNTQITRVQTAGLEPTILVMLIPLLVAAAVVWWGGRRYGGDVAAAMLSEEKFPPAGLAVHR